MYIINVTPQEIEYDAKEREFMAMDDNGCCDTRDCAHCPCKELCDWLCDPNNYPYE